MSIGASDWGLGIRDLGQKVFFIKNSPPSRQTRWGLVSAVDPLKKGKLEDVGMAGVILHIIAHFPPTRRRNDRHGGSVLDGHQLAAIDEAAELFCQTHSDEPSGLNVRVGAGFMQPRLTDRERRREKRGVNQELPLELLQPLPP